MPRLPPRLPLLLLLLPILMAACKPEEAPAPPPGTAEARLRRGLVSISGDETTPYALDWRAPTVVIEAAEIPETLDAAAEALAVGHLFEDAGGAIPLYLGVLSLDSDNQAARDGLAKAREALLDQGLETLEAEEAGGVDLSRAHAIAAVARAVAPDASETLAYLNRLDAADRLHALLEHGEDELAAGNLGEDGIGAATAFREVLRNRPGDARAMQGLAAVESRMIGRAEAAVEADDFNRAYAWLASAAKLRPEYPDAVDEARRRADLRREARVARLYAVILRRLASPGEFGALRDAQDEITRMRGLAAPDDPRIAQAEARLELATRYGRHRPGQRFSEPLAAGGGRGPSMVVVPHGRFLMGAPENERDSDKAEWPQHEIVFQRGFAMARTETTVAEFGRFIAATGYRTRAERRGYSVVYAERSGNFVLRNDITWKHDYAGRQAAADLPVLHMDVRDAEAYADWLSAETGQRYRLPSEAEFEYVLRGGHQARFPWGEGEPPHGAGNLTGSLDRSPSGRRWGNAFQGYGDGFWGPAPVARDRANVYGLHGLAGNVAEWTMDCWHQGYRRAPADGGAWFNPGCRSRVVRGGAWSSAPVQARAAWRMAQSHDITNARTGFRVVRDL